MTDEPQWTVGDLRRALEGMPDGLPVNVNVTVTNTHGERDGFLPFTIVSCDVGMTNVGDDLAPEPYSYVELNLSEDIDGALLFVPWPQ